MYRHSLSVARSSLFLYNVVHAVASFREAGGGVCGPPRIVKCKSFALSVSSKGSQKVTVCNVLSDDMDVLHNCLSHITITNSEK